jgi:hypothetical protein
MKFLYFAPIFLSLSAYAQTDNINSNVNWQSISTTPQVNQQVIEQDFVPFDEDKEKSLIQDELVNFEFLNQSIDERVFYNLNAKIKVLNKYTDAVTDYTLKGNQQLDLGKTKITVKSCAIAPIYNIDNKLAYVEVTRKDKLVFNGWMSNVNKNLAFPELKEIYVNLVDCEKVEITKAEANEEKTDKSEIEDSKK